MHGRRASGEPLGGIRYCHMIKRNTKRIEEVAFLGRRRQEQKSWQVGPRWSRWGFRRRDFSNRATGKSPDRRDRVNMPASVPDQSIALGNLASKALRTSKLKWGGAPSCWNHMRACMLAATG
ncbi:hypothetical protein AVEN_174067-1 [Araneus ventricosus]|uniref:Uncharacterized protein n=1 Tax=Araneus ventricosus TaxID=182803 RepID=A0A4Y2C3R2_ARAVE|nr:hypothetical protein AVEN_174067-1 [Araneus ventricosus]